MAINSADRSLDQNELVVSMKPNITVEQNLPGGDDLLSYKSDEISLVDLLDIGILQNLQDSFAIAAGVASIIIDQRGKIITQPSNFNPVCELIYSTSKGRELCDLSNKTRDNKAAETGKPFYHQCRCLGFVDAIAPIYIGDKLVARWLMGQSNVMGITREAIAAFAESAGADVPKILAAFDRMPAINLQRFEGILNLLYNITDEISKLGSQNLKLKNEINYRNYLENELKRSELKYQELFNSIMEGIGYVDENEIIRLANPAFAKIFGFESSESILNHSLLEFVPVDDHEIIHAETQKRKEGKSSQYELTIKNARDEIRILLVSVTPRFDSQGKHIGGIGALIDITEKKRLEQFSFRAKRLEAAGRIAAQVAHDFNNLLGPLIAYPDLIRSEIASDSEIRPLLDDIEISASIMADINQQLLTLGRRGSCKSEIININNAIYNTVDALKEALGEVRVELDLGSSLFNIKGSLSQLTRVIANIVNNSLDAMPDGGSLTVKTENYYLDNPADRAGKIPCGEYIKVTIADSGTGINSDSLPYIFDPFYTTKTADKKRGSGLGLSIVHAVMEDHNGFVDIDSQVGRGTSIFLYFPISRDGAPVSSHVSIVGGAEKILVVDDDRLQRELTIALLTKLGYQTTAVENGLQAVDIVKKQSFDLIVLDMNMPVGPDGADTYRRILKICPGQKAVVVSGFAESASIEKAQNLGAGGFLKKPLTLKSLAIAVREELDRG